MVDGQVEGRAAVRVSLLTLIGLLSGLILYVALDGVWTTTRLGIRLDLWALAVVIALAESVSVTYRSRDTDTMRLSLGTFGWAVLLPVSTPERLMAAAVIGILAAQLVQRKPWQKTAFNTVLTFAAVGMVSATYRLVAAPDLLGPRSAFAVVLAVTAGAVLQLGPLQLAIRFSGARDEGMQVQELLTTMSLTAVMAILAAVTTELWTQQRWTLWLVGGLVAIAIGAFGAVDSRQRLIAELRASLDRLAHRERHDRLTELPNRLAFTEALAERCAQDLPFALLLLDLDRFRDLNDTLGHDAGDRLLVETARRLRDVVPEGSELARLSGNGYAVLLPGIDDTSQATSVARGLLDAVQEPHERREGAQAVELRATASAGLSLSRLHGLEPEVLLRRAEIAMFVAKDSGRGLVVFEPGFEVDAPRRLWLAAELRKALDVGAISLAYQPKVSLTTGEVTGVEALARWIHPDEGFISPGEFIPVAERTGLIRPLTKQVIAQALVDLSRWQAEGVAIGMALNVSPRVLDDDEIIDHLAAELIRSDLAASRVTVEVTESMVLGDSERVEHSLHRLDELGTLLSIDDYGTGYSSLSHLRRLNVHELKIDRSFVSDMVTNPNDAVLVDSTIKLARALGLTVVAEGVEDQQTVARLRGMDCDRAQGYHLARPMPSAELLAFVRGHDPRTVLAEV